MLLAWPALAMDRQSVLTPREQERVIVIRETVGGAAGPIFAVLHDWEQRSRVQTPPVFDHWVLPPDSPVGIGAWAEYDLRLGDRVTRQRMVIADEQSGRYLRERSDQPQQPYEIHWLLEPIGDGAETSVIIAIHLPQSRNWFASLWQQWTTEPALRAAYATIPGQLANYLKTNR
jgi:hypothetical protein